MSVQIIRKDGQPEWAVIPYDDYQQLVAASNALDDIRAYDEAKQQLADGEEVIPSEVTFAIIDGENPIRVWRAFRGLTQQQLADQVKMSRADLAQLELGQCVGSAESLQRIANALGVSLEDILSQADNAFEAPG